MRTYRKNCYFLLNREANQILIVLHKKTIGFIACTRTEEVREGFTEELMSSTERKYGFKPGNLPLVII